MKCKKYRNISLCPKYYIVGVESQGENKKPSVLSEGFRVLCLCVAHLRLALPLLSNALLCVALPGLCSAAQGSAFALLCCAAQGRAAPLLCVAAPGLALPLRCSASSRRAFAVAKRCLALPLPGKALPSKALALIQNLKSKPAFPGIAPLTNPAQFSVFEPFSNELLILFVKY